MLQNAARVALLKHNLDQVNPVYNSSITFQHPRVKMQPYDEIDYLDSAQLSFDPFPLHSSSGPELSLTWSSFF